MTTFCDTLRSGGSICRTSESDWWVRQPEVVGGFQKVLVRNFTGVWNERYIRVADYDRKDLYPTRLRCFVRRT
jgi:hypothetical protein